MTPSMTTYFEAQDNKLNFVAGAFGYSHEGVAGGVIQATMNTKTILEGERPDEESIAHLHRQASSTQAQHPESVEDEVLRRLKRLEQLPSTLYGDYDEPDPDAMEE